MPTLQKLKQRKVRIVINTPDPHERDEAYCAITRLQREGIQVFYTGGHHRKLVVIDRSILYECSLNVSSQNSSLEVLRWIESVPLAWQMVRFTNIERSF